MWRQRTRVRFPAAPRIGMARHPGFGWRAIPIRESGRVNRSGPLRCGEAARKGLPAAVKSRLAAASALGTSAAVVVGGSNGAHSPRGWASRSASSHSTAASTPMPRWPARTSMFSWVEVSGSMQARQWTMPSVREYTDVLGTGIGSPQPHLGRGRVAADMLSRASAIRRIRTARRALVAHVRAGQGDDLLHEVGLPPCQLSGEDAAEAPAHERDRLPGAVDDVLESTRQPVDDLTRRPAVAAEAPAVHAVVEPAQESAQRSGADVVGEQARKHEHSASVTSRGVTEQRSGERQTDEGDRAAQGLGDEPSERRWARHVALGRGHGRQPTTDESSRVQPDRNAGRPACRVAAAAQDWQGRRCQRDGRSGGVHVRARFRARVSEVPRRGLIRGWPAVLRHHHRPVAPLLRQPDNPAASPQRSSSCTPALP